jgi:hypothetical protein
MTVPRHHEAVGGFFSAPQERAASTSFEGGNMSGVLALADRSCRYCYPTRLDPAVEAAELALGFSNRSAAAVAGDVDPGKVFSELGV